MCFRCFGKSSKKYSPKWCWKMVMNPMVQSVKSHLKQITRICTNMLVPRRTSFFISPNQKSQNQSKSPIPPHLVVIPIVLVHVWLRQPGLPVESRSSRWQVGVKVEKVHFPRKKNHGKKQWNCHKEIHPLKFNSEFLLNKSMVIS